MSHLTIRLNVGVIAEVFEIYSIINAFEIV